MAASELALQTPGLTRNNEDPQTFLYLAVLIEIFMQDQSPANTLCSLFAMCWIWPSGYNAEEDNLNLGSALLSLGRLVKKKVACLVEDVSACLPCQRGSKQAVIMG